MTNATPSTDARIICGRNACGDEDDLYYAMDIAIQLNNAGLWDGEHDITIHEPHQLHSLLQSTGDRSERGYWPGITSLIEGQDYEIASHEDEAANHEFDCFGNFDECTCCKAEDVCEVTGREGLTLKVGPTQTDT